MKTHHLLLALLCSLLSQCLVVNCLYIPAEVAGTLLIPSMMRAGGMSLYRIGKMIGVRANTNHGIHGGPIHHVFPTTFHSHHTGHTSAHPHHLSDNYYDDYDEDEEPPQPPKLHSNVVAGHLSEGTHYHFSTDRGDHNHDHYDDDDE